MAFVESYEERKNESGIYTFINTPGVDMIVEQVYGDVKVRLDPLLMLYEDLLPRVLAGKKTTTVRYGGDRIRVPAMQEVPLYLTRRNDAAYKQPHGKIVIPGFTIKKFSQLDEKDAMRDGYTTAQDLKDAIARIYEPIAGPVDPNAWVSIYDIKIL